MSKKVWVLADDRAGNVSQSVGIANALDIEYEIKNINYNILVKLPNVIRSKTLLGVDIPNSSHIEPPYPDIIISTGRRTVPIARYIKKKQPSCFIIQIMWPGKNIKEFDFIVVPEHDNIKPAANIITTIGAPNKITETLLKQEANNWEEKFNYLPKPYIALLIGGNSKKGKFTVEDAKLLAKCSSNLASKYNASILITASRRTSKEVIQTLEQSISVPHYLYTGQIKENPYLAFLGLSDYIIVTGDSISMCSESCSAGKPVFIFAPEHISAEKHQNFHQQLYLRGLAKPLLEQPDDGIKLSVNKLNEAARIANIIKEKILL